MASADVAKNSIFPFLPNNASMSLKVNFAKRLACHIRTPYIWTDMCAHTEMCLFARASKISVDHHHAEKGDKKGIMKIERQREGIMIGLLLMEVWR